VLLVEGVRIRWGKVIDFRFHASGKHAGFPDSTSATRRLGSRVGMRLLLDARNRSGTTRQLELALFGRQTMTPPSSLSQHADANLGQTVGANTHPRKNPHGLPTVVISYNSAISADDIGVH